MEALSEGGEGSASGTMARCKPPEGRLGRAEVSDLNSKGSALAAVSAARCRGPIMGACVSTTIKGMPMPEMCALLNLTLASPPAKPSARQPWPPPLSPFPIPSRPGEMVYTVCVVTDLGKSMVRRSVQMLRIA